MIILSNEKKLIKAEIPNKIAIAKNNNDVIYKTQLPIIESNDFEAIAYIQQKVNELVYTLVHESIK